MREGKKVKELSLTGPSEVKTGMETGSSLTRQGISPMADTLFRQKQMNCQRLGSLAAAA
jgi:hypothetical protein